MALVKLKDVAVVRVNQTGYGVQVEESNEFQGKTFKQRFTLWFKEPHGLREGDVISASGFLGAKVSDPWTDKEGVERRTAELSLNSPRLDTGAPQITKPGLPVSNEMPF